MLAVHPTAIIDSRARLGPGVVVGPYSVIGAGVTLGEGTVLGSHVVVEGPTEIGPNCRVGHHATLGTPPQDLGYAGEPTRLVVGAGTYLGEYVNVSRASTKERWVTRIGADCYLMAYVHIGHDCTLEDYVMISNGTQLAGHCLVEERAYISGVVGVGQFIRIGACSITSGGSSLNQDVAPYSMVSGVTAELVGVNRVGLRRSGFTADEIDRIKRAFRTIFHGRRPMVEAVRTAREEAADCPRVGHLLDFIESSKKGVCRRRAGRK